MRKIPRHSLYINLFELLFSFIKILIKFKSTYQVRYENIILKKIKKNLNSKTIYHVSTWRIGFYLSLKSLGLKNKSEVLTTSLSIPDQINSILLAKMKPVYVDLDLNSHGICLNDLKKKISNKTKVLHLTYLSGIIPSNLDKIMKLAKKKKIIVIEDISQAYGANFKNKQIGSFGDIAVGSLSTGKMISSIAGGLIFLNNKKCQKKLELELKKHSSYCDIKTMLKICFWQITIAIATNKIIFNIFTYYYLKFLSIFNPEKFNNAELRNKIFNKKLIEKTFYQNPIILRKKYPKSLFFKLTSIQLNLVSLTSNRLYLNLKKIRSQAKMYLEKLPDNIQINIPKDSFKWKTNAYWHFPITFKNSNEMLKIKKKLFEHGVDCVGYSFPLIYKLKKFNNKKISLKNTDLIKNNTIFLPIHSNLSNSDIENVIKVLKN